MYGRAGIPPECLKSPSPPSPPYAPYPSSLYVYISYISISDYFSYIYLFDLLGFYWFIEIVEIMQVCYMGEIMGGMGKVETTWPFRQILIYQRESTLKAGEGLGRWRIWRC